jgi:hypothetical protein
MIRSKRPISHERLASVRWAARLGAITAEALAERDGISARSARAKLAAAEREGMLRRADVLRIGPPLYTATPAGLRLANASSLGPCRVSASNAAHLGACAFAAAALERRYPGYSVRGERELRRDERQLNAPIASAKLPARGAAGGRLHRPDLVLVPASGGGRPVAVEVELTAKSAERLAAICRGWARARCVAGVLYLAAPEVEAPLRRAIGITQAGERIIVIPLETLTAPPDGRAPESARQRSREPSQAARTVPVGGSNG